MSDNVASTLGWIANYSSFYSVSVVLICFILMVIFILRLNADLLLHPTATRHRVVEEQRMLRLKNPFSVHPHKEKTSSLKDGVYLEVSVLDTTQLAVVWGVNIQAFQQELQMSSTEIWERYNDKKMFGGDMYMEYHDCGQIDPATDKKEMYIECPSSVTEATLGEPPRTVYPIVIVTVRQNPHISLDYTAIVLQFTVLHLKDTICSLDSHIVYQFLKTNHSQLFSLQPIFVSAAEMDDNITHPKQVQPPTSFPDQTESNKCNNMADTCNRQHGRCEDENLGTSDECKEDNIESSSIRNRETSFRTKNKDSYKANSDPCGNELSSSGRQASENSNLLIEEHNLCVVCQNAPVFYTLLLCRHACVCFSCIKLLDRCPMCRGFIDSYFRLDGARDPVIPDSISEESPGPRLPWWEVLNNRLNHMLGFD